jgi:hypothetical protein
MAGLGPVVKKVADFLPDSFRETIEAGGDYLLIISRFLHTYERVIETYNKLQSNELCI